MMIISVVTDKFSNLYFLVPAMSVFIGFSFRDATITNSSYFCYDCHRKGNAPLTRVPLQSVRVDRHKQPASNIIEKENFQNISRRNKIFTVRNILMMIGLVIAIIGMIFGDLIQRSIQTYFG